MKKDETILNCAQIGPHQLILMVPEHICFYKQLKEGNRSNGSFKKNTFQTRDQQGVCE